VSDAEELRELATDDVEKLRELALMWRRVALEKGSRLVEENRALRAALDEINEVAA
jgi:hypothetical protein